MTVVELLLGRSPRASLEGTQPLTSTSILEWLGGRKTTAGKSVTETSALGMSAVWRAVNIIAGTAAALPLHAFVSRDGARVQLEPSEHELADVLDDPHPDMTRFDLWELVYGSLCLWGNAYLLKLRDQSGRLVELWWINPARVKASRTSDGSKLYVIDGDEDNPRFDDTILHIPGFGYDGVCGVSPIRLAREGIGLAQAAEEFGSRLFGSGSLATGLLQTEQRIDQTQADEIKARWKAAGTGLDSAHDIRVVGSGVKFHQLTIPPEDAQFLQTREFQITEIARWFGMPPHMLAQVDKSTSWGTGIEVQQIAMVTYTFGSWLTRVEQRIGKAFLPARNDPRRRREPRVFAKYTLAGLLRGDSQTRAAFYTALWQMGALSTNDIRRLEDMAPVDGGDVRYVPLNMGRLGEPATVEVTAVDGVPSDSTAAEAARIAQQLYLAEGKVLGVDEARAILRRAGIELDDRTAAEVFADVPPAPGGGAPAALNASDAGRVLAASRGRALPGPDQLQIEGMTVDA